VTPATTTRPPPHPTAHSRQRTCPPPDWLPGGLGDRGWFPRSPCNRSVREAPSSTPAASPGLRRRPSPWPPHRRAKPASELTPPLDGFTHCTPARYPPDLSRQSYYGASTTGALSLHLLTTLAEPAPSGSTGTSRRCQGRLPPSPAFPRVRLPPASSGRCDDPTVAVFHLHSTARRLVAHLLPRLLRGLRHHRARTP
jgi:hypothetical protein